MRIEELPIKISSELREALNSGMPVVALESTIIAHGMSYPFNVQLASEVEAIVRKGGATPATIAILDGVIRIGLDEDELERLGTDRSIRKCSKKDLPIIIATGASGATTVSATMFCASLVGIKIFVTGGIGGVHRGAETSFDISSDLTELQHTQTAVVCAGAKSILDIPLTLEQLETYAVPVIGYQTDEFPSFYSRESGCPVDYNAPNTMKIAEILKHKWDMGISGGAVIACPIPKEFELPAADLDKLIKKSLKEAEKENIRGKYLTPFILQELHSQTRGKSLEANCELVKNNAAVGSELAKNYCELVKR